jgi:integrase
MTVVEHNNATSGLPVSAPRASTIVTLGDLISFINASNSIPASQKRYLRSALNRARVLLGNGLADVRADPEDVLRRLDQLSPAMVGMTPQSWANLKSRVRSALRHAAPRLAPARSRIRLEGEWAVLAAASPRRERCQLSRLFRFAHGMGWQPGDIGEPQLEQFEAYLEDAAMHADSVHVVRLTRRAWNRCVDTVPGWPKRRLAAPARRGTPYYLRLEQLPATLQQEIEDYLHRLEHPDPFLGPGGKTLAPTTIGQLRLTFITLASALVASGMPVNELIAITTLVQPDNLERALRFLYARAGHRVYHLMFRVARRARTIGAHVGLSEQDLALIDSIVASVRREHPAEYGLTPKNRRLLAHFDDPAFVNRLLTFPHELMQSAQTATNKRHAASRARDAVAVELLLMCSMRLGNLADLRVGETIRQVGEGHDAYWVVDLPAELVKNRQSLRFLLPPESGRLIEWYLTNWHAYWCGPGAPWLFPAPNGGHVDPRLLTISIKKRARRHVGVEITCHQFRHLSSEIFLQAHPLELGVVSQHLGHRKLDTTRTYYAREQTRVATERYHQVLARKRAEALARPRRKRRHKGSAP